MHLREFSGMGQRERREQFGREVEKGLTLGHNFCCYLGWLASPARGVPFGKSCLEVGALAHPDLSPRPLCLWALLQTRKPTAKRPIMESTTGSSSSTAMVRLLSGRCQHPGAPGQGRGLTELQVDESPPAKLSRQPPSR